MHYYITGDTHGDFSRIAEFCESNGTNTDKESSYDTMGCGLLMRHLVLSLHL